DHDHRVDCQTSTDDRGYFVTAGSDLSVRLWEADSGREMACLRGSGIPIQTLACSPSGDKVAAYEEFLGLNHLPVHGSCLLIWRTADGTQLARIPLEKEKVTGLTFSPDGRRLACGTTEGRVRVWDADSGREQLAFPADGGRLGWVDVVFSPDGRRLASF